MIDLQLLKLARKIRGLNPAFGFVARYRYLRRAVRRCSLLIADNLELWPLDWKDDLRLGHDENRRRFRTALLEAGKKLSRDASQRHRDYAEALESGAEPLSAEEKRQAALRAVLDSVLGRSSSG